jgi:predicted GIY-YIG superfamily endonuclease
MHWVYVLKASDTNNIYIGETTRLYRRWREHEAGKCKTTSFDDFDTIIGLYSVGKNCLFMEYRERMIKENFGAFKCMNKWEFEYEDKQKALFLERHIAERYLLDRGITHQKVYGSFYLNDNKCGNFCFTEKSKNYIRDRPLCHCSYPCEIKMKGDKSKLYFTCPVPDWVEGFSHEGRCSYYQEFEPYRKIVEAWENKPTARQIFGFSDD